MSAQPPNPLPYAMPVNQQAPKRFGRGVFSWLLFIGLAVMLMLVLQSKHGPSTDVAVSEVFFQLGNNNVSEIVVDGDVLRARLKSAINLSNPGVSTTNIRAELPPTTTQSWSFIESLIQHPTHPVVRVENNQNVLLNVLLPLVPWLLIFLFIWFVVFRQMRNRPAVPTAAPVYMVPPPEQK
jgi:ATP-dependent Zn protease